MSKTVRVIAYRTPAEARRAADYLTEHGMTREDVSVLMSEQTHGLHFAVDERSKGAEGTAAGAVTGGVLGAIGATAAAIAGVTIPGVGSLAAGPIMTALAGAGAGAAGGSLVGGLVGLGIPEHEAKMYEDVLAEGAALVGLEVTNEHREALVAHLEAHTHPIRVTKA